MERKFNRVRPSLSGSFGTPILTKQQNNKTTKQQNNKTTKQQNNKTTKQQMLNAQLQAVFNAVAIVLAA